jgi:hypothetical protein
VLDQTTDLLNISDNFPKRTDQGIRCMEALEMLDRRNSAHTPLVGRPFTASSTDQPPGGDAASHSILLPKARKQPDKQSDKRKASGATHPRQQKHGRILKHPEIASDDSEAVFVEGSEYEDGSVSDGDGGSVSSNRSDNDDADAFQKPRAGAKTGKNVARNTKRARRVAAAKALEPSSGSDEAYKLPPTQAEAHSIEFVEDVTSFNTMAEVQNNVFAMAELHNRKVVSSGRLVEVMVEKDRAEDREEEEEEELVSGSEDGSVQLVYVPKKPKASQEAPPQGKTRATGANNKGVEYTALCPHACGGLTQFLFNKKCWSYVCKKHRPCMCPPSTGKVVVQREATHAFTAASLAPVILEQVCRWKESTLPYRYIYT